MNDVLTRHRWAIAATLLGLASWRQLFTKTGNFALVLVVLVAAVVIISYKRAEPLGLVLRASVIVMSAATILVPDLLAIWLVLFFFVWPMLLVVIEIRRAPNLRTPLPDPSAGRRARAVLSAVVVAVAGGTILYRLLVHARLEQTAGLFIGIPTLLTVIVIQGARPRTIVGVVTKTITIFLLMSAIFLGEGFVCVLMAAPLFYSVGLLITAVVERAGDGESSPTRLGLALLLVVPMSLEGALPRLSFPREESVTVERSIEGVTPASVAAKLAERPRFGTPLPFFLRLGFPRPERTEGSGLAIGDRRVIRFAGGEGRPGNLELEVRERNEQSVVFEVIRDESHVAHWLTWERAEVRWEPREGGATLVSWTLCYRRELDPAWYFGPWERYAVSLAGDYLLQSLIVE